MSYNSPLGIYVFWHKDFRQNEDEKIAFGGHEYARFIYSGFCRDIDNPLSRGVGIPVYYRSELLAENTFQEIPFHESERNAVIILAESNMANDSTYRAFIQELISRRDPNTRVLFFTLDKHGSKVSPDQDERLFTTLHNLEGRTDQDTFTKRSDKLHSSLLPELTRLLFDERPSFLSSTEDYEKHRPPGQLFISYARKDGEKQATELHDYIVGKTKIDTFLDVRSIQLEEQIGSRIKDALNRNTALIVIQTDEYANREWCREEVITAKTKGVPVIVVNALKQGEKRSFPYLGNAPTIPWDGNCQRILDMAMVQILQRRFANMSNDLEMESYEFLRNFHCTSLGHSPELFDFVTIRRNQHTKKPALAIYPDPPIGLVEIGLLREIEPGIQFITPASLPMFNNQIDRR